MTLKKNESVDIIKNYLLSNGYRPGDRIPIQSELAAALSMSARHLRDGVNILVNQGFLIPKGRAGTFMSNPQQEVVVEPIRRFFEVKDISDYDMIRARQILEQALIVESCANRTTKDLLELQQIVDEQASGVIPADKELELDKEFHIRLIACAHNKALDIVGNVILLQLDLLYERGLYPEQDKLRSEDHQKIIDAVYQRDVKTASELISQHIERCCSLANRAETNPLKLEP